MLIYNNDSEIDDKLQDASLDGIMAGLLQSKRKGDFYDLFKRIFY